MSICKQCNIEFEAPRKDRKALFCSIPCYLNWKKSFSIYKICQKCGKEFRVPSYRRDAKFCSYQCRKNKFEKQCRECGITYFCDGCDIKKSKFCSRKCQNINIGKNHRGEKNSSWKGGITPQVELIRRSAEYQEWRHSVFIRDKFTCVECGKVGGKIISHHIKKFSDYPELRMDLNNGVTLCEECHKKTHFCEKKWEKHYYSKLGFK
jgi:5-methylcytosine-specific restriction endonuclease McrA